MVQEQLPASPPLNRREILHNRLLVITNHVYFQAPKNIQMQYPCIRYGEDDANTVFADNHPYRDVPRYELIVIDEDPDSALRDAVKALPMCRFVRRYVADDLHHFVFNLFF